MFANILFQGFFINILKRDWSWFLKFCSIFIKFSITVTLAFSKDF